MNTTEAKVNGYQAIFSTWSNGLLVAAVEQVKTMPVEAQAAYLLVCNRRMGR